MAGDIQNQINKNPDSHGYPFNSTCFMNIGNPQYFPQQPVSFFREVLACTINPKLLENSLIHQDVKNRAK